MQEQQSDPRYTAPVFRRLRAFAFDPSLGASFDTAFVNEVCLNIPWEDELQPGPTGEYLQVIDDGYPGGCVYAPVDLNHPYLLATDGLASSEGNPQFHQQMVYAVAMKTIRHFETALGRRAQWAPGRGGRFVQRLRLLPHGMEEKNAYYSPQAKSIRFGYFVNEIATGRIAPGSTVFTCLSHDIIAHETAHALLDGMHQRFIEPSNPDVLAFHEAFADIVALFQHFTLPEVLRQQLAQTRGNLGQENLLTQLAHQLGDAVQREGALRTFAGQRANSETYQQAMEPHGRGAVLVGAVFDGFLAIYGRRIADLIRIATGGSGVLPVGDPHPDLVRRLAMEAAKAANHVLTMCIRALDYCPVVDITFGEYLRALITADFDLVRDDDLGYRVAMVEAFRRWGIYPEDVRGLSQESLIWQGPAALLENAGLASGSAADFKMYNLEEIQAEVQGWKPTASRKSLFQRARRLRSRVHSLLADLHSTRDVRILSTLSGLALGPDSPASVARDEHGRPLFAVTCVWPARRIGPDGQSENDLVIAVMQERRAFFDPEQQRRCDAGSIELPAADFTVRGGCTIILDLETGVPRYFIRKNTLAENRLRKQRQWLQAPAALAFTARRKEPFAFLHGQQGQ